MNAHAVDWSDVIAFIKTSFPQHRKNFEAMNDEEYARVLASSWGPGDGFHGDGGDYISRVLYRAYTDQSRLAKLERFLKKHPVVARLVERDSE